MQKARRHIQKYAPTACRRMVSGTISLSSSECFSPFLHSTRSLSVSREYLALPDGPGRFAQNYTCSALLRIPLCLCAISNTGLSPSMIVLSRTFFSQSKYDSVVLQPLLSVATKQVWAIPRSLATTRGIIIYFLFLKVLRCFSSLRSPHYVCSDNRSSTCWVVPFGNPWIKGYLHLPKAYRSLSRPSSPP